MATLLVAPKPFYEIQGEMAESQIKQQDVEMNQMKIEQAKRDIALEQQRSLDMQKAYQMSQANQQQQIQAPGEQPQQDVTQLAKQPQVQPQQVKAPDGTPMPSFMKGATAEEAAKAPAEDTTPKGYTQQVQPDTSKGEQSNVMQDLQNTKKDVDTVDQAIRINDQAIQLAYQRGDAKGAEALIAKNQDLKTGKAEAQLKHFNAVEKSMDLMGRIGNFYKSSYNQFLKDNPNATPQEKQATSDRLWAETLANAQYAGIPADKLMKAVTPDQRNQIAAGLVEGGLKGSDLTREKIADLNREARKNADDQKFEIMRKKQVASEKVQNARANKLGYEVESAAIKEQISILKSELRNATLRATKYDENAEKEIPILEKELAEAEKSLTNLGKQYPKDAAKSPAAKSEAPTIDEVPAEEKKPDTKESLPAAAISKLKEGQNTTFNNGQVWTLKNGKPVRVK